MKTILFQRAERQSSPLRIIRTATIEKLALKLHDGIKILEHKSILYCKSDSNYTEFHLVGGKKIIASKTLKSVASVLPGNFIRIHQSYLVNLDMVSTINNDMVLIEGSVLPISRSHKQDILELLKRNIALI